MRLPGRGMAKTARHWGQVPQAEWQPGALRKEPDFSLDKGQILSLSEEDSGGMLIIYNGLSFTLAVHFYFLI